MNYRDLIFSKFGENAFAYAIFYKYENSLRFELSEGLHWIDKFFSAYKKAEEVTNFILEGEKSLYVCFGFYGGESFLSNLSIFKNIKLCEIKIPKEYFSWREEEEEYDDVYRRFILFESNIDILKTLLWGALSLDLCIKPCPRTDIYIINKKLDTIIHPYDDRGMDVVSTNNKLLTDLYTKFSHYLYDYDREKMDRTVGAL